MARTTLSRRIRRIGLLPSVKNENGVTDRPRTEFTPEFIASETARIRAERNARRKKAGK